MFGDAGEDQYEQFRRPTHIHVIPKVCVRVYVWVFVRQKNRCR